MTMAEKLLQGAVWGGTIGALIGGLVVPIAIFFDRIVVWIDDRFGQRHFLLARQIAAELRRVPDEWVASLMYLRHNETGIELVASASGEVYEVRTEAGRWEPNLFEKRILARAVQWRMREKLGERVRHFSPQVSSSLRAASERANDLTSP